MVNKNAHHPLLQIGSQGLLAAIAAGAWGFLVAIASALPCIGDEPGSAFVSWLCTSGSAGWLYLAPMVLLPMVTAIWIAAHRRDRWELLIGLVCTGIATAFVPSIIERLW